MPNVINPPTCSVPQDSAYPALTIVEMNPDPSPEDYLQAMQLANREADHRLGEYMLLSWYDKDRDFESPRHASECHMQSAVPGYVDYGLHHGANLKIDMQQGRFVFFYLGIVM